MKHKHERISQIIPAQGWVAAYAGKIDGDLVFTVPLVCWAVVEYDCPEKGCLEKDTDIRGMMAEEIVDECNIVTNFLGYARSIDEAVAKYGYMARSLLAKFNGHAAQQSKPEPT